MNRIVVGNALEVLPRLEANSIHCSVSSPPYYGLRRYRGSQQCDWPEIEYSPMPGLPPIHLPGCDPDCEHEWGNELILHKRGKVGNYSTLGGGDQERIEKARQGSYCQLCGGWRGALGNEPTLEMYIGHLVAIYREVYRVLREDGVAFIVMGDSFAGSGVHAAHHANPGLSKAPKRGADIYVPKSGLLQGNLMMVPHRLALALQADSWIVRNDLVYAKKSPMPESLGGTRYERHRIKVARDEYEVLLKVYGDEASKGLLSSENREAVQLVSPMQSGMHEGMEANSGGEGIKLEIQALPEGKGGPQALSQIGSTEESKGALLQIGEGKGSKAQTISQTDQHARREKEAAGAKPQILLQRTRTSLCEGVPSGEAGIVPCSQQEIQPDGKRERNKPEGDSKKAGTASGSDLYPNKRRMGRNKDSAQLPLSLLWGIKIPDDRPRNISQQGRKSHEGECGASLPKLQLPERNRGFNPISRGDFVIIDCPGCPKCEASPAGCPDCLGTGVVWPDPDVPMSNEEHRVYCKANPCPRCAGTGKYGGYVLRRGSWRHTRAHEFVFMLTKRMKYYANQEAVREPSKMKPQRRLKQRDSERDEAMRDDKKYLYHLRDEVGVECNPSGRNPRSVLTPKPEPLNLPHFAAYPTSLITNLIEATCPDKCCPKCGTGWSPLVERETYREYGGTRDMDKTSLNVIRAGWREGRPKHNILGYRPTCECNEQTYVPGTVLDPFVGSGTTALVAIELNLHYYGCDTSQEYVDLANERIAKATAQTRMHL